MTGMLRDRLRATALVGLLAASFVGLTPSPARAKGPTAHGWWWRGTPEGSPVGTSPPWVPADGLYVAADPTQPAAFAALRFLLDEGFVPELLTLGIADHRGEGDLVMCPASEAWIPAQGGPLESAPAFDCSSAAVPGTFTERGTVTFAPATLTSGSTLDVVVLPAPAEDESYPLLSIAFQAPVDDTLSLAKAPATPPPPTGPPAPPLSVAPPPLALPQPAPPIAAPSVGEAAPAPSQFAAPPAIPSLPISQPTDGFRTSERVALLLLLALAVAYLRVQQQPARGPRRLGTLAGAAQPGVDQPAPSSGNAVGGLGRFARPRAGRPPRI